ncbi:alpha/beta hydrolase domain-containing protein [Paenibacillus tarimensis]
MRKMKLASLGLQVIVFMIGIFLLTDVADARITRLEIDRVEPFADGEKFGNTGSYVKIAGTAYGELDPDDPLNEVIVNLDKAPRNAEGLVEYDVDFYIMRPADLSKGNHKMLYEVTNRGRKFLMHWLHDAPSTSPVAVNDPATLPDAGNGFVFREGYTVVWSGWDPDAPTTNDGMTIRVPVATNSGEPIVKIIRDEFVFGTRISENELKAPLSYEAASLDQSRSRLTVRTKETDSPVEIPADQWTFVNSHSIKLLPESTKFEPGLIYDFHYPAKDPKVLGIGYAATRDLVSFLRYETKDAAGNGNPIAADSTSSGIETALGLGISQSGRYLHDHIELGFNQDESDRIVFDGVMIHIAGAGKVFANTEFGQPNRTSTQHEDHQFPENRFPFTYETMTDPVSGRTGALLRGNEFDPLVIDVNTSTEYWQKGASLLHTDPLGTHDIQLPDSVRLYLISGTQHGGRIGLTAAPGRCANPKNPHNPSPALRALLVALDKWATEELEPPESRVPSIASGTLVQPAQLGFPLIPGVKIPHFTNQIIDLDDWVYPKDAVGRAYTTLVPQVDRNGNELSGIRLPWVAASLGTYTGWNFYKAANLEEELCDRDGSYLPFSVTKEEREAKGDPRLSLEELYGNHGGYMKSVSTSVRDLVRNRLLLPEDAAQYLTDAANKNPFKPKELH